MPNFGYRCGSNDSFDDNTDGEDICKKIVAKNINTSHGEFHIRERPFESKVRESTDEDSDVEALLARLMAGANCKAAYQEK